MCLLWLLWLLFCYSRFVLLFFFSVGFAHVIVSSSSNSIQRLFVLLFRLNSSTSFIQWCFYSRHFGFVSNATFNKVSVHLLPFPFWSFVCEHCVSAHRFINFINYSLMILHFSFMLPIRSLYSYEMCRNYLLKKRLSKGPNKIVLSSADFVFPIDMRRVSSFLINVFGVILFKRKVKTIFFDSLKVNVLIFQITVCRWHHPFGICKRKKKNFFLALWMSNSL